ncbi:MAG TPA: formylglycine-generating enzyme family protein [Bradyrhizobium sp.]|nr:formylglycine-generating enzyme family protein [Bradyrhizobium sp.]
MSNLMKIRRVGKLWLVVAALAAVCIVFPVSRHATAGTSPPEPGSVFRDCPDCPEMVVIPAGKFMMGSSPEEVARDVAAAPSSDTATAKELFLPEQPRHEVAINMPFALAKYPVTKGEFAAFVQETGYMAAPGCMFHSLPTHAAPRVDWKLPGLVQTERDPVVCVNWQDAKAYIGWLNKKVAADATREGPYRLPSEAEWEYAARAGTRTVRWWGDTIGRNNAVCTDCGSKWDQARTAPVGSFNPNPFGLHDMLGNVWQWIEDCWEESYIDAPADGLPRLTADCTFRVWRGGSWATFPWVLRSATRASSGSDQRYNYTGFRVARTLTLTSSNHDRLLIGNRNRDSDSWTTCSSDKIFDGQKMAGIDNLTAAQ